MVRTLRVRQRLTQSALASRAGIGRRAVSTLECGRARLLKLGDVEAVLSILGARLDLRVLWNGPELDRLLDAGHAAVAASVKRRLERWGWLVRVEVSYSRYGERGRIDLLAWHPATRLLLVVEIKTDLVDVQQLLGSLDVKARLARHVAATHGWDADAVVPAIVFAEDRTVRRRLTMLDTLFDRFGVRGRAAISWLRSPEGSPVDFSGSWTRIAAARRCRAASARPRLVIRAQDAHQRADRSLRTPNQAWRTATDRDSRGYCAAHRTYDQTRAIFWSFAPPARRCPSAPRPTSRPRRHHHGL